jgi:serine/threonine-protein kinase RsbW
MEQVKFTGVFKSLEKIGNLVIQVSTQAGLSEFDTYAVQLAVDEACSNIIEHAYGGEGKGDIWIKFTILDDGLKVEIVDYGEPFDPHVIPDPQKNLPLENLKPGGLGLFLMRKMMDEVYFDFTNRHGNRLTMVKWREGKPA